jgi:hypothetical protein
VNVATKFRCAVEKIDNFAPFVDARNSPLGEKLATEEWGTISEKFIFIVSGSPPSKQRH